MAELPSQFVETAAKSSSWTKNGVRKQRYILLRETMEGEGENQILTRKWNKYACATFSDFSNDNNVDLGWIIHVVMDWRGNAWINLREKCDVVAALCAVYIVVNVSIARHADGERCRSDERRGNLAYGIVYVMMQWDRWESLTKEKC